MDNSKPNQKLEISEEEYQKETQVWLNISDKKSTVFI